MPIRHVGILAKRASTWPRDHFCRSMIAPRSLWPTKRVLADIDADHGDCALQLLGHGVLLVFGAPSQHPIAGGAGARPDHPISGHWEKCTWPARFGVRWRYDWAYEWMLQA